MFGKRKLNVEKLSLEQGDLIVLRTNKGFRQWVKVLQKVVEKTKKDKNIDVTGIVLPEDSRFGKIGEKEMNNMGWYRDDKFYSLNSEEYVKKLLEENKILKEENEVYKTWNHNIKELYTNQMMQSYNNQEYLRKKLNGTRRGE